MDHTFLSDPCDQSRHSGIRQGTAFFYDPSQVMAAHGLDHVIHILPCGKARAKSHSQWCHIPAGPKILFCKDGIDHCLRLQFADMFSMGICQKGDLSLCPAFPALGPDIVLRDPPAHNAFYLCSSVINSFAEGHMTADGTWTVTFQDQDLIATLMKLVDHSCGQISATSHKDHFISKCRCFHLHTPAVRFSAFLPQEYHKAPHRLHPYTGIHKRVPRSRP